MRHQLIIVNLDCVSGKPFVVKGTRKFFWLKKNKKNPAKPLPCDPPSSSRTRTTRDAFEAGVLFCFELQNSWYSWGMPKCRGRDEQGWQEYFREALLPNASLCWL